MTTKKEKLLAFSDKIKCKKITNMAKKPNSAPVSLHKVIMVGSGGVGKSAVRFSLDLEN